ncbi:hypothetical protein OP10G_3377 [Fimbriimonas ginsengisoli Gsoil 348]|uniref:Uncharacterized protein n=1 Tax=Fimbriimonas ginsengisoli Gsoil 348 TaxID=661478 RepID=A0A068NVE2_FIMGI|nr:hypothetical protein OP10G_3377 [Fimbriimonas ginsengisoli Gsoil 348]
MLHKSGRLIVNGAPKGKPWASPKGAMSQSEGRSGAEPW